ncbi:hypothetical protein Peur_006327 [Populus x canadensis]
MSNVITVTSLLIHHKTTTVLKAQYHLRAISNELGREDSSLARPQKGLSFMEVNSIFNFNCCLVDVQTFARCQELTVLRRTSRTWP